MYQLTIVTPENVVFDEQVHSLTAPGSEGYLQILTHHAPIITSLKAGTVTVVRENQEKLSYTVLGGFLEVSHNRATLLADALSLAR